MGNYVLNKITENNTVVVYKNSIGLTKKTSVFLRVVNSGFCTLYSNKDIESNEANVNAHLIILAPEGIYAATIKLLQKGKSNGKYVFECTMPTKWKLTQRRISERVEMQISFKLSFNDGFEINAKSFDIATKGISFVYNEQLSNIYKKINGKISFDLKNTLTNETKSFSLTAKFVRTRTDNENTLYIYTFTDISSIQIEFIAGCIKNYILEKDPWS